MIEPPIAPNAIGPKNVDFTSGYRNATKGATLKALQQRRADMAAQVEAAMKPREIASPWQGAAQIAGVIGGSIREGRAANQEAAGRARFAELLAGGLAPDEIGEAMGLDTETTMKYQEHQWNKEAADKETTDRMALELQKHGWSVDEAAQRAKDAIALQENQQTFTAGQQTETFEHQDATAEEAAREADRKREADAKIDAAKAEQDAILGTKEGELDALVKADKLTPEGKAEQLRLYTEKLAGEAAAAGPDQWQSVTPEQATAQGGDVGRNPGNYKFNAKTGEFKPIEKARSSTDIAAIDKASTGLIETRSTMQGLQKAVELLPNILEGGGMPFNVPYLDKLGLGKGFMDATQRADLILQAPEWAVSTELRQQAKDTKAYFNIMGMEAIQAMKTTLSGASTEFEMQQFIAKIADPGTPMDVKQQEIQRFQQRVAAHEQRQLAMVKEMGGDVNVGRDMSAPGATTPPPATSTTPPSEEDIAETMRANNMTREEVLAELARRQGGGG